MKYDNQLVNTGKKSSVGYDIQTNVNDSYRAGIEFTSKLKLNKLLDWQLNLNFSNNKINNFVEYSDYYDSEWNYLGNLPKELGKTDISYSPEFIGANILTLKAFDQLEISLISKYVGKQYFDNTSDKNRMLDPYFVNNIKLYYSPNVKFIKHLGIFFQINNILNTEYESNAYGGNWYENAPDMNKYQQAEEKSWAYYYPQAGITLQGGITLRF